MQDNPRPHPAQKEGPFLPRMNDGGILGRFGERMCICCAERGHNMRFSELSNLRSMALSSNTINGHSVRFFRPANPQSMTFESLFS
jgi:hypothetical protein